MLPLKHIAQFIRPLLGEAGEMLGTTGHPEALRGGFVGLAFLGHAIDEAILFAQTISEDPNTQKQDWDQRHLYSRAVPFVAAVTAPMLRPTDHDRYELTDLDLRHKGIAGPLAEAFGQPKTSCTLVRCKLSDEAILYYALSPALATRVDILHALARDFEPAHSLTRSLLQLSLMHCFFLAKATLPSDEALADWLSELKQGMQLPKAFFNRFLKAQAAALDDLQGPSTWLTAPFRAPELAQPIVHPKTAPVWLRAIRGAGTVAAIRPLSGSFQGRSVHLVLLSPRNRVGLPVGEAYPAVVKTADLKDVVKEHWGYLALQQYSDDIRDVMPPLSVAWRPDADSGQYVVVTPRVSGETLREFIKHRWDSRHAFPKSRTGTLIPLLQDLLRFTRAIGASERRTPKPPPLHQPLLDSHLGESDEADRRRDKTIAALSFFLGSFSESAHLVFGADAKSGIRVLNPLRLFNSQARVPWKRERHPVLVRSFTRHGDLHTGNILVAESGRATVLDFNYVGEGYQFEDEATLEASLLLSIAGSDRFRTLGRWQKVFPPLVRSLASQTDNGAPERGVLQNADAYDIWILLQKIREPIIHRRYLPAYRPLVASALLRLTASLHRDLDDPRAFHRGLFATALLYLGVLLDEMTRRYDRPATAIELFDIFADPLKWRGMSPAHPYLRAVFRWLSRPDLLRPLADRLKVLEDVRNSFQEPNAQATVCRFALRIIDRTRESNLRTAVATPRRQWESNLAECYADEARGTRGVKRRSLLQWADHHKGAHRPRQQNAAIHLQRHVHQPLSDRMDRVERSHEGWRFCAVSRAKQRTRARNEDAFTIMHLPASQQVLVAIADGTGDSHDGARASRIVLSALRTAVKRTSSLRAAVLQAHSTLQEDNREQALDGASCLVAGLLKPSNSLEIAVVGDSRYVPVGNQPSFPWSIDKAVGRFVLGGEPLGDIVTSSGNIVHECERLSDVLLHHCKPTRFALVSDGAYVSSREDRDTEQIKEILAAGRSPGDTAEAIVFRSLRIFESAGAKPDDVTVIVGWRDR